MKSHLNLDYRPIPQITTYLAFTSQDLYTLELLFFHLPLGNLSNLQLEYRLRLSPRRGRSSLLDDEDLHQLNFNLDDEENRKDEPAAKSALERWLSARPVLSTASSNAIRQQEAPSTTQLQVFRSIGKGFCGEIYE